MTQVETPKTITLDGVEYQVANLGPQVQALTEIHAIWRRELAEARLVVAKHEAAIRSLEAEMIAAVQKKVKGENQPADSAPANENNCLR